MEPAKNLFLQAMCCDVKRMNLVMFKAAVNHSKSSNARGVLAV